MLIDNKQTLVKYIPSADGWESDLSEDNTSHLFSNFKPYLEESERWVQCQLLGNALFALAENNEDLRDAVCRVIACNAYYSGIPFVDLEHTASGFAVISTATQAPASKERVERLLRWLNMRLSEVTDQLIKLVFQNQEYNEQWKKFELYDYYTECIFMTASSFRQYARKGALREDLEENHAVLMHFQHDISRMLSEEYMQYLIDSRRNSKLTPEDIQMIGSVMTIMGLKFRGENDAIYSMMESLVNAMEKNLDKYPAYKNSVTYRVKHSANYENKKDDRTFFF